MSAERTQGHQKVGAIGHGTISDRIDRLRDLTHRFVCWLRERETVRHREEIRRTLARERAGRFKVSVVETHAEPFGRVLDNVARYLVARMVSKRGGLALHGAGVLRGERGWIFAGPSGSGKSTASRLSAPSPSLGDDFAVVMPEGTGFATCALPSCWSVGRGRGP